MKENTFIKEIIRQLDDKKYNIGFAQFRSCNAYVGEELNLEWFDELVGDEHISRIIPIKSYRTIVGFVDVDNKVVYEYGKYSTTTSKQFTQIYNSKFRAYERVLVDVSTSGRW